MSKRKYEEQLDVIKIISDVRINEYLELKEYYNVSLTCRNAYRSLNNWTSNMITKYLNHTFQNEKILGFLNRIQKPITLPILKFYDFCLYKNYPNIRLATHLFLKSNIWHFQFNGLNTWGLSSLDFIKDNNIQLRHEVNTLHIQISNFYKNFIPDINRILKTGKIFKLYFVFEKECNIMMIKSHKPIEYIFAQKFFDDVELFVSDNLISFEARIWTKMNCKKKIK